MAEYNPYKPDRRIMFAGIAILMFPVWALALGMIFLGVRELINPEFTSLIKVFGRIMIILPFAAALLLLVKILPSKMRNPAYALVLLIAIAGFIPRGRGDDKSEKTVYLDYSNRNQVGSLDILCNGVKIGTTPLTISEQEFKEKVQPLNQPPEQEYILFHGDEVDATVGSRYSSANYSRRPDDPIARYKQWPPDYNHELMTMSDEKIRDYFKSAPYWWSIEKKGMKALLSLSSSSGSSGSDNKTIVRMNHSVNFPAVEKMYSLLYYGLHWNAGEPDDNVCRFFLDYQDLLFETVYIDQENTLEAKSLLDKSVRMEFKIPDTPSEKDWKRVIEEVMNRVEQRNGYLTPSMESYVLEMVPVQMSDLVARMYHEEKGRLGRSFSRGRISSGNWQINYRDGQNRLLPLEDLVKRLRPPQLLDELIYRAARGDSEAMALLMAYSGKAARRVVNQVYQSHYWDHKSRGPSNFERKRFLSSLAETTDAESQSLFESLVQKLSMQDAEWEVERYLQNRIRRDGGNSELLNWIFHWAPLEKEKKIHYIIKIRDKMVDHYLRLMQAYDMSARMREDLVYQAGDNPSMAPFILDTWKLWYSDKGPGYKNMNIEKALVRVDAPETKSFILQLWTDGWTADGQQKKSLETSEARRSILQAVHRLNRPAPHLNYLLPLIAEDDNNSVLAVYALERINTPEAWQMIRNFAKSEDEELSKVASQKIEEQDVLLQRYKKLITRELHPSELVDLPGPWVWNGDDYVLKEM